MPLTRTTKSYADDLAGVSLPIAGVILSLLISALLIVAAGVDPLTAYAVLIEGAFGTLEQIGSGLNRSTPLILAGLGVMVAFRAGAFNIGAEGQIAIGGLGATALALAAPGLPGPILLPLALFGGALAGGLWASLAALITLWRGVHEVVVTLLLNFVALLFVGLMLAGPLEQPGMGFPQSPMLPQSSMLPIVLPATDLHAGFFLALLCVAGFHVLLWRMPLGFEIRAAGQSSSAARYAGINVGRTFFVAMSTSGMLGGLAGAVEVMGIHYRLIEGFSEGLGFDAIAVALLGGLSPLGVLPASLFIGFLKTGAGFMQRGAGVPSSVVLIIMGLAILLVMASISFKPKPKTSGV